MSQITDTLVPMFGVETCFANGYTVFSIADKDKMLDFIIENARNKCPVRVVRMAPALVQQNERNKLEARSPK